MPLPNFNAGNSPKPTGSGLPQRALPNPDNDIFEPLTEEQVKAADRAERAERNNPVPPQRPRRPAPQQRPVPPKAPVPQKPQQQTQARGPRPDKPKPKKDFIDEQNLTLKAFGGRKQKPSEFDKRKNANRNAKIVRTGVIGLIVILVGLGVKNAVIPPDVLGEQEVGQIVNVYTNNIGFPLDKGESFARAYVKSYLSVGDTTSTKILGFLATGAIPQGDLNDVAGRGVSGDVKQEVLYGPDLTYRYANGANAAEYVFSSLVSTSSKVQAPTTNDPNKTETVTKLNWVSVSVQLYYDKDAGGFAVVPDSTTLLPSVNVNKSVPKAATPPGADRADSGVIETVTPLLNEFFKAYAVASPEEHTGVDQYVIPEPPNSVVYGLSGAVLLKDPVKVEEVYKMSDGSLGVVLTVPWLRSVSGGEGTKGGGSIKTPAKYIVSLVESGGKYLVSNVDSYTYRTESDG